MKQDKREKARHKLKVRGLATIKRRAENQQKFDKEGLSAKQEKERYNCGNCDEEPGRQDLKKTIPQGHSDHGTG